MKKPLPSIQELETQKRHVFEKLVVVEYEKLGLESAINRSKLDNKLVSIEYEKRRMYKNRAVQSIGGNSLG